MNNIIPIDRKVEMPDKTVGRPLKYPFNKMEVKDSFGVDYSKGEYDRIKYAIQYYKRNYKKNFSMRSDGKIIRVWRVK